MPLHCHSLPSCLASCRSDCISLPCRPHRRCNCRMPFGYFLPSDVQRPSPPAWSHCSISALPPESPPMPRNCSAPMPYPHRQSSPSGFPLSIPPMSLPSRIPPFFLDFTFFPHTLPPPEKGHKKWTPFGVLRLTSAFYSMQLNN